MSGLHYLRSLLPAKELTSKGGREYRHPRRSELNYHLSKANIHPSEIHTIAFPPPPGRPQVFQLRIGKGRALWGSVALRVQKSTPGDVDNLTASSL